MRLFAVCALALACAACGQSPGSASSSPETVSAQINPARIDRVRAALPSGYEVARYPGTAAPVAMWGFGEAILATPPQCLALGVPAVDSGTTTGWSASGPGGIVYAVVAGSSQPDPPDTALLAECQQWTLSSGHTTGTVTVQPGPDVRAAHTVAMSAAVTTVVEGGTETLSRADTFAAYLVGYVCFVALVTDPGSSGPTLQPEFAADLLGTVVSALRG